MLYGLVDGISCVCYPFIDTCACVCVFVHVCKLHTHHVYAAHCSTYALTCVAAQSCVQTALKWQQYLKEFGFQALAPPWLLVVQPSNAFNTTEHLHIFSGYHGQFRPSTASQESIRPSRFCTPTIRAVLRCFLRCACVGRVPSRNSAPRAVGEPWLRRRGPSRVLGRVQGMASPACQLQHLHCAAHEKQQKNN